MRIELFDEAEQDLIDGFEFYERQEAGLGPYFLDSLFSDIESLQIYAGLHAMYFGYYRLLAKRFPYAIYYRLFNDLDLARVYAVLDCRRSPERIAERLRK